MLEAVTVNGELCGINRFDPVLTALKKTNNPMLQLACLQFINAIVNTPEDIDFKIHLRNEFMRGGLGDMLAVSECVGGERGEGGERDILMVSVWGECGGGGEGYVYDE